MFKHFPRRAHITHTHTHFVMDSHIWAYARDFGVCFVWTAGDHANLQYKGDPKEYAPLPPGVPEKFENKDLLLEHIQYNVFRVANKTGKETGKKVDEMQLLEEAGFTVDRERDYFGSAYPCDMLKFCFDSNNVWFESLHWDDDSLYPSDEVQQECGMRGVMENTCEYMPEEGDFNEDFDVSAPHVQMRRQEIVKKLVARGCKYLPEKNDTLDL